MVARICHEKPKSLDSKVIKVNDIVSSMADVIKEMKTTQDLYLLPDGGNLAYRYVRRDESLDEDRYRTLIDAYREERLYFRIR